MLRRLRRALLIALGVVALFALLTLTGLLGGLRGGGQRADEPSRSRPPHRLEGSVLTADGGAPPPGTLVFARGSEEQRPVEVDEEGRFQIEDLPVGVEEIEVVAGPLSTRVPVGTFPREVCLPREFDAAGRVVEAESGRPVAAAEVECGDRRARTDERGRFRLEAVAAPDGIPPPLLVRSPAHDLVMWRPGSDAAWDDLYVRVVRR